MLSRRLLVLSLATSLLAGWGVATAFAQAPGKTPEASVPGSIPAEARQRRNPIRADAESLEMGALYWSSQCAMCHGAKGDGKGDLIPRLGYTIKDFRTPAWQGSRTDGELFYILTEGHGKMQAEGQRLNETIRWHLVNHMRTLKSGS
jgi:mono/diheme cytochrome c family protein